MADSRLGPASQSTMQPDKHKEGGESNQGKEGDMSPAVPPVSSSASSASTTTTSSTSSSSSCATTTVTTTTTSSPSSSSTFSSTTFSTSRGTHSSDVSSSSSTSDSNSVSSHSRVTSAISVGSGSVGASLSSPGMGNPFARATLQGTWGSTESCEQRPILAPSRLSSHTDSGPKVTSSGILRPPSLGAPGRLGGPVRPVTGVTFFPPPTLTVTGSSPPQTAKSEFKLKPSVLGPPNPFAKSVPESPGEKTEAEKEGSNQVLGSSNKQEETTASVTSSQCQVSSSTSQGTTTSSREEGQGAKAATPAKDTKNTTRSTGKTSSNNTTGNDSISNSISGSRNMFLPLSRSDNNSDSTSSPTLGNSSFIFGQNLHSKVTSSGGVSSSGGGSGGGGWGLATDATAPTTNGEKPTGNLFSEAASEVSRRSEGASGGGVAAAVATGAAAAAAGATTNGQPHTGNLFSDAASEISRPGEEQQAWGSGQSLAESSRELTEKEKNQKRKFDEVEVITGEENESNVLQMNCKLYAWVSGWWQERGRGILRLNDWDAGGQQSGTEAAGGGGSGKEIRSRLVIRTQGTLTVMLNTKVWAEMSVERASNKSVRFTALDADGQPKIFLAMGSPKDVDLLHNSLEWRVAASRAHTHEEAAAEGTKKAKTEGKTSPAVPL